MATRKKTAAKSRRPADPPILNQAEELLTKVLNAVPQSPPQFLYHYTSLEVTQKILEGKNIRLSHAQYSNDSEEGAHAIKLIYESLENKLKRSRTRTAQFYRSVKKSFKQKLRDFNPYVFCLSSGNSAPKEERADKLSQWRGYARDGEGAALEFRFKEISNLVMLLNRRRRTARLRINKIYYEPQVQKQLLNAILTEFSRREWKKEPDNTRNQYVEDTVQALLFMLPLCKHPGFREESEWRLIVTTPNFELVEHDARNSTITPHINFSKLLERAGLQNESVTKAINRIVIGPSQNRELSKRSFAMQLSNLKLDRQIKIAASEIPYRKSR